MVTKGDTAKFVKDINPGPESSNPENFTMIERVSGNSLKRKKRKYIYFQERWNYGNSDALKLKGNGNGQTQSDINSGPRSLPPELLSMINNCSLPPTIHQKGANYGPSPPYPRTHRKQEFSSTETIVSENKKFVYQFSSKQSEPTPRSISGGEDAFFSKSNRATEGTFRQAPD